MIFLDLSDDWGAFLALGATAGLAWFWFVWRIVRLMRIQRAAEFALRERLARLYARPRRG